MRKLTLAAGVWALLSVVWTPHAGAQYAQATGEEFRVSSTSPAAGDTITVTCVTTAPTRRCADGGAPGTISIASQEIQLGSFTADASGNFSATVTIPADLPAGAHTIFARTRLNGQPVTYTEVITVQARPGGLPITGRDIALLAVWGALLVGFGVVLLQASRGARLRAAGSGEVVQLAGGLPEGVDRLAEAPGDELFADLRPAPTPAIPLEEDAGGDPAPPQPLVEAVERAVSRTSELVSRLEGEIEAWSARARSD